MLDNALQYEFDNLMGLAAHDLVEPLRKIQIFGTRLQTLLNSDRNDEAQYNLDRLMANVQNMNDLINQIQIYSRVNRTAESPQPINLDFLVNILTKEDPILQNLVIIHDSLPQLHMGYTHVKEVIRQIFCNTAKFYRKNTVPTIHIKAERQADGALIIHFQDEGIGIDGAHAENIFKPFFQLHNKSDYPGAGLGLAIVKQTINFYNGNVKALPSANGLVLSITIPKTFVL